MPSKAKWATPNRQRYLVKLFVDYGNKCLLGHSVCNDIKHYIFSEPKTLEVAEPINMPCKDIEGNTLKDNEGNTITLLTYGIKKVFGYELKTARLYEFLSDRAIDNWKCDDKVQRLAEWQNERYWLHRTNDRRYPVSGQFSGLSRDIFFDSQPQYYIEALGISGLTFKPFCKVRLPSSYLHLYIELGDSLKQLSKNQRRKAVRYGKPIPTRQELAINDIVRLAVRHYLKTS